jgi:NAD(P)-dependent dehydrogenase (short-subunit alcohol dehydrogenase family)
MNLSKALNQKVVVVTGSSRGIGREIARLALESGARVILNGRNPATLEVTRSSLGYLDRSMAVVADLTQPEEAEYLVAAALTAWGQIDMVIHNAGLSMRGAFADLTPATVKTMIDANLLSAVWVSLAALPSLRASGGRITFVSSLAAMGGFPGVSLYSAAKMALEALHRSIGTEERAQGVSTRLVYLPFTENDPEKTVLDSTGRPFFHERPWVLSQRLAASAILKATLGSRRATVLTAKGVMLSWVRFLAPGLLDWYLFRSGGRIHNVSRGSVS